MPLTQVTDGVTKQQFTGWMDGWMDGWIDPWMDGWIDPSMIDR